MVKSSSQNAITVNGSRLLSFAGAIAMLTAGIGGCRDSTAPVGLSGLSITAPQTIHFTTFGDYRRILVPVTIRNSTNSSLNLAYCSESLERFTLPNWRSVWSPICLAALISLPTILPGTSQTIDLAAEDTPLGYAGFRFSDPENSYRARFGLFIIDGDKATPVPADAAVSNRFEVVP